MTLRHPALIRHAAAGLLIGLVVAGCAGTPTRPQAVADAQAARPVIPYVDSAQQTAAHWIARAAAPDRPMLDAAAVAAQNGRLLAEDPSVHDVAAAPDRMPGSEVRAMIAKLSKLPTNPRYDIKGKQIPAATLDGWLRDAALDAVPASVEARPALVTRRADLRSFPTATRVFSRAGDTDIDRFQESALFPGTPVRVLHESRDRDWVFVLSPRYAAWMRRDHLALGSAADVFAYATREPWLLVTGTRVETVYTPEQPQLSRLSLDMGTRVPLLADWPDDKPVNGQLPAGAHVIELPVRDAGGRLTLSAALLPKSADVSTQYLPLTPRGVLTQGFKFLGERYGWGHSYDARDCSGFVSEVYSGFGVKMPRNTSDQGKSPAFNTLPVPESMSRDDRLAMLKTLQPGDLVYIPGHVMMVVGHENGLTYVIHDTPGVRYADASGNVAHYPLNAVSVTPLEPIKSGEDALYVDKIYSIQRMRR
ncbi:NlpC-P60 family protein [Lysobacter oculi]|uniref:NlpC-P60 family protein n=1 Tax=Solilutibacter oculi TaxID=2698682 RepID=A0A344J5B7_9GAMM|nr:SH3 domain-containing protein [Lysobacter oculi]AXA84227.1 NlpC-P60 family protein [Lysobacter oculi]